MEYHSTHEPGGSVASHISLQGPVPSSTQPVHQAATQSNAQQPSPSSSNPSESSRPTEIVRYNTANGRKYVYPATTIPNPSIADQPLTTVDPALGELERPHFIPVDLDSRVDRASVWMKTVPGTGEVVFFIPGSCSECLRLQQHCDRASPVCGRCQKRGASCTLQGFKHLRPSAPVRGPSGSMDKGKGRANGEEIGDEGRGKRVKKKRRLSADDEMDPNTLNFEGTAIRKARPRPSKTPQQPSSSAGYLRPEDIKPTPEEEAYAALAERDVPQLPLDMIRGKPPFWAERRSTLQAAITNFNSSLIRTDGAWVDYGHSGIARGVVLDGMPHESIQPHFFGEGERAGTILANVGKPRRRYWSVQSQSHAPGATSPLPMEVPTPSGVNEYTSNGGETVNGNANNGAATPVRPEEERAVESLLMAHRANMAVAVAVTPAYAHTPFKVRKAYLGLGWFWVVDAWTELAAVQKDVPDSDKEVVWRFRFEWASTLQSEPWWSRKDDEPRMSHDCTDLTVKSPQTVDKLRLTLATKTLRGAPANSNGTKCGACERFSSDVYEKPVCLNEECVRMVRDTQERLPSRNINLSGTFDPPMRLKSLFKRDPPYVTQRVEAQADMWHAWVCARCRLANERRDWAGLLCEWCAHVDYPRRKAYTVEALHGPRPTATGARAEEGFASWAADGGRTSALFPDEVKAVRWQLPWAEVVHVLGHQGVALVPNAVLKGLQIQGRDEVPFRRHAYPATSSQPSELVISHFYTYLAGPDGVPLIAHLPTGTAVPWTEAPKVTLDAMDLINERAGRIYPGDPEFNSLLLATVRHGSSPTIPLSQNAAVALLILGADCTLHVRRARRRAGELTAQHGDVVLFKMGPEAVEVEVRADGFAFVGLARRAYEAAPTEIPSGPLTSWYMGPWPLDRTAPLRPHIAFVEEKITEKEDEDKPKAGDVDKTDEEWDRDTMDAADIFAPALFRGIEVARARPTPTILKAPEHAPLPCPKAEKKVVATAGRGRGRGRGGRGGRARGRGRGRGRGGSSRASTSATPMDEDEEGEEELDDFDDESD
ncbi:hypothetical protein CspHIS471_0508670 [Cutaneotrichosporon sp. HIS471]|nr:hypothetical protein CspHIS471_0508670 [Cutaneotrichosporon sp. HIS471]